MENRCGGLLAKTTAMHTQIFYFFFCTMIFSCCSNQSATIKKADTISLQKPITSIREIPLPPGFSLIACSDVAYTNWLLDLKFKNDKTVFLYNGQKKQNQFVQYAVLDIDIGKKDLLQCADAAIKLKADFLYTKKRYPELNFIATSGDTISYEGWKNGKRWKEKNGRLVTYSLAASVNNSAAGYNAFMEYVFSYCGTYSLCRQLGAVAAVDSVLPGDIFIEGGFPGHAISVMAVAANNRGEKLVLLSQGFMPAQDIHLLKNYADSRLSPWFKMEKNKTINTPEWVFEASDLKR